jgi:hypothetical protein
MPHRYNLQPTESRPTPYLQRLSTVTECHTETFSRTREHKPPLSPRAAGRGLGGAGVEPLLWSPTAPRHDVEGEHPHASCYRAALWEGRLGSRAVLIEIQPSQEGSARNPLPLRPPEARYTQCLGGDRVFRLCGTVSLGTRVLRVYGSSSSLYLLQHRF